jgi:hypothetical protein
MVNNQQDGTKERRPTIAVFWCVISQVLATGVSTTNRIIHACGMYQLCNKMFVSAIEVPNGKRGTQNCKEPLYEICILKTGNYDQQTITKTVGLSCGPHEH